MEEAGISPDNWLLERSRTERLLQEERVVPTFPVSLLLEKLSRFRFWQLERTELNMVESEILFSERSSLDREGPNLRLPPGIELWERFK